jgi:hypothetical protein
LCPLRNYGAFRRGNQCRNSLPLGKENAGRTARPADDGLLVPGHQSPTVARRRLSLPPPHPVSYPALPARSRYTVKKATTSQAGAMAVVLVVSFPPASSLTKDPPRTGFRRECGGGSSGPSRSRAASPSFGGEAPRVRWATVREPRLSAALGHVFRLLVCGGGAYRDIERREVCTRWAGRLALARGSEFLHQFRPEVAPKFRRGHT